jgi:uncharacterized protein (TIGR02246 family)
MTTAGRSTILTVTGLFLLAGAASTEIGQTRNPKPIEEAVLAINAEMERAAGAGDADRLFSFMLDTDKGSIIQNGVFLATREDALQRVKGNLRGISKVEYRWKRQYVTVLSADVALLTAEGESVATTTEGQVFTTPFAQTVVFVMREGHWKALHAHQSSPRAR